MDKDKQMTEETTNQPIITPLPCKDCETPALMIVGYLHQTEALLVQCKKCYALDSMYVGEDKLEPIQHKSINKKNHYVG